jgi:hypothetical protein
VGGVRKWVHIFLFAGAFPCSCLLPLSCLRNQSAGWSGSLQITWSLKLIFFPMNIKKSVFSSLRLASLKRSAKENQLIGEIKPVASLHSWDTMAAATEMSGTSKEEYAETKWGSYSRLGWIGFFNHRGFSGPNGTHGASEWWQPDVPVGTPSAPLGR